jgi:hypothetical protein
MLALPEGLTIERSLKSEQALTDKCRTWLTQDARKDGIHASDLLDPMMAYWKRKKPQPLTDRLVNMFIVGKFAHIIILSAVDGVKGIDMASDEGSKYSEELGIWYSPDKMLNGIPREVKTTRSFYDAKTYKDLALYIEQELIYQAAENSLTGQLWIMYLNLKEDGKTTPSWRVFTIKVTQAELDAFKKQLRATRDQLVKAIETDDYKQLPLCRVFKCRDCEYFEDCQPAGRYGVPQKQWDKEAA